MSVYTVGSLQSFQFQYHHLRLTAVTLKLLNIAELRIVHRKLPRFLLKQTFVPSERLFGTCDPGQSEYVSSFFQPAVAYDIAIEVGSIAT